METLRRIAVTSLRIAVKAMLWCLAGCILLVASCAVISWATDVTIHTIYPSPDRRASVITEARLSGGAAGSISVQVYLVGGAPEERVDMGLYFHEAPRELDGWRGANTYNLCSLRWGSRWKSAARLRQSDGSWADYRITADCPSSEPGR